MLARSVNSLLSPRPKKIPSDISRNLQMSPNFNQNTRWILRSIFEVIKILVVNSRPLSLGLCDQWSHGVICKHNISKNQGLTYIWYTVSSLLQAISFSIAESLKKDVVPIRKYYIMVKLFEKLPKLVEKKKSIILKFQAECCFVYISQH